MRPNWGACAVVVMLGLCGSGSANAGWLSSLVRETVEDAGGAAGRAGRSIELAPVRSAVDYLDKLGNAPKGAFAAHATSEGHWQFVNRDGQTFTVGTPDEMVRVLPTLAPEVYASGTKKMTLYLSEDSVFANKQALAELPENADLKVVAGKSAFEIRRLGKAADLKLRAILAPHLEMELADQAPFEETAFLLSRPLNKANIRTIAFDASAAAALSSAPKIDPLTKVPLVDLLDPSKIDFGLRPLRGQTALVTGRVEGKNLIVAPAGGDEVSLPIDRLVAASEQSDVNLVILQSDSSRQAGGRNWLWQKITIGGLDAAAEESTFGDFLDALAARRGGFLLDASPDTMGRVRITAVPDSSTAALSTDASNVIEEIVSHVTGEVVTNAVNISARDHDTQTEHDIRIVPWLPAGIQFAYIGAIVFGIAGWATARKWWSSLLGLAGFAAPAEKGRAFGRVLSGAAFFFIFLPLVGLPAFTVQAVVQLVRTVMAPFWWIRRRFLLRHI
jgi:hypothetical protein